MAPAPIFSMVSTLYTPTTPYPFASSSPGENGIGSGKCYTPPYSNSSTTGRQPPLSVPAASSNSSMVNVTTAASGTANSTYFMPPISIWTSPPYLTPAPLPSSSSSSSTFRTSASTRTTPPIPIPAPLPSPTTCPPCTCPSPSGNPYEAATIILILVVAVLFSTHLYFKLPTLRRWFKVKVKCKYSRRGSNSKKYTVRREKGDDAESGRRNNSGGGGGEPKPEPAHENQHQHQHQHQAQQQQQQQQTSTHEETHGNHNNGPNENGSDGTTAHSLPYCRTTRQGETLAVVNPGPTPSPSSSPTPPASNRPPFYSAASISYPRDANADAYSYSSGMPHRGE